jgi:alginate O-acetyltransferase complex protein AlgI
MLLGGLWHGASWNFVLWGGIHGLALVAQKAWSRRGWSLPDPIAWAVTQLVILTAWVPFRAATFSDTRIIVGKMWGISAAGTEWWPSWLWFGLGLCLVGHIVGLAMERRGGPGAVAWQRWLGMSVDANPISGDYVYWSGMTVSGMYILMMGVASVLLFAPLDTSPFIYFQF